MLLYSPFLFLYLLYITFKTITAMGNFLKGAVFGAAAALLGNYLLNTEEGKETCKKVKDKVRKTADEMKAKLEEGLREDEELNKFPDEQNDEIFE